MTAEEAKSDKAWISAYIDREMHKRFRIACAEAEETMSERIGKLIEADVKKAERKRQR